MVGRSSKDEVDEAIATVAGRSLPYHPIFILHPCPTSKTPGQAGMTGPTELLF